MKWYAKKAGNDYQGIVVDEETGRTVAVAYDRKDAALLAAAPELLRACKQFMRYAEGGKHPHLWRYLHTIAGAKLRDAVAEAEGRE